MFDYIAKRLNENANALKSKPTTKIVDEVDNKTILEYAHIFQELEEVSLDGAEPIEGKRKMNIDIPLEMDDIELNSVEMKLSDGTISDVRMDNAIDDSVRDAKYDAMKTEEDFVKEAYNTLRRLSRETDTEFYERCYQEGVVRFEAYTEQCFQEGKFGSGMKFKMSDPKVPSTAMINFGKSGNAKSEYVVKMKVYFQTTKGYVYKQQLDALSVGMTRNVFVDMTKELSKKAGNGDVWETYTPTSLKIPFDKKPVYIVNVVFTEDQTGKEVVIPWKVNIKDVSDVSEDGTVGAVGNNTEDGKGSYQNKNEKLIEESHRESVSRFDRGRFYQEAIDFNGDGGADDGQDEPMEDESGEPSVDTGDDDKSVDVNDDYSNDVSDKVVDKMNEDKEDAEAAAESNEVADEANDIGEEPTDEGLSVEDQLAGLDSSPAGNIDTAELGLDSMGGDIENMTISDLIENGTAKLKDMTIGQLKSFLDQGDDNIQEAFILTKKNINGEMDIAMRACLGVLNNNKLEFLDIVKQFKKEGKKLNRILGKAERMNDVYTKPEISEIITLNKHTSDLIMNLKENKKEMNITTAKKQISSFVNQCKIVGKFVEDKIKGAEK